MSANSTRQLTEAIRIHEEQLLSAAKGNPQRESALRWSKAHIPYEVIAPFMTKENLALLAQQKMARRVLVNLSRNRLRPEDRFLFWDDILSAVEILPTEWRAEIFLDCLESSETWTPREHNGKQPHYNYRDYDREEMSRSVASSKWLIDAPLVCEWYCRLHKPGFELLRCLDLRREGQYPMRERLMECIRHDDLPKFALLYTMGRQGGGWGLLQDVLQNNARQIFAWLVDDSSMIDPISPYQLMVYIVANLSTGMAVSAVESVERRFPKTMALRDEFGNQLLWYCLHNKRIAWCSENNDLVSCLCGHGCRRDNRNHLNLSFEDVCQALSPVRKRKVEQFAQRLSLLTRTNSNPV